MHVVNPVIPGFYPDPSLCRVGEDYYLVTSTFAYFPGVPVFHSRDLVHWRQIGHCLTRDSQLPLAGVASRGGIYAPTLRYHAGRFYMVTTNVRDGGGHFYVWADDPAGPWSEPVQVDTRDLGHSIDPSLLFDDDGTVYFTCNGRKGTPGIHQFPIDIATGQRLGEIRFVWTGTGGRHPEAPHLYHIGDWYYLLIAEGGTEYAHMVTLARSTSPWGPFEACPHNPILTHRGLLDPIQATGHADLIQAPDGRWWLVCLGIRTHGYPMVYHLGRETFLAPVTWDADGWPHVGWEGRLRAEFEAEGLVAHPWPEPPARDNFDAPELGLDWNFLRNPHAEDWSLAERPGWLRLHGSPLTLDEVASPAFVGRRQRHFACRAETLLDFEPGRDNEEAGLTVYMNEHHHYDLAVTRRAGLGRCLIIRRRIGSLVAEEARVPLAAGPVRLGIEAREAMYTFLVAQGDAAWQPVGQGETRYLSTEVAGGFTGVYFGMFASGRGGRCTVPADFDWFEVVTLDEA